MADRVPASITIGGSLPAALLPAFAAFVAEHGLSTEWDGEPFTISQLPSAGSLTLMAHEVAWGRFEALEAFCVANALPFARWSGAFVGQFGAERVVFDGTADPASYTADEDDVVLIGRQTLERLGSLDAIRAFFDAADFAVPALMVGDALPS